MHNVFAVDLGQGVEDAFRDVTVFVPKFLGFLIVLVVGYFIAKAIAKIANAALERLGFDRAVERGGIKQALSRSRYDASDILAKVIFYALFLLVLQLAFGVFGPNPVSDLITGMIAYLPRVIVAILIVVIFAAIAAAAKSLIENSLGGMSYGRALASVASISILVVGAFAALNQLQIAPQIFNALFYALLAIVVGSAIIAIGGGGIQPMRSRWEQALTRVEDEAPQARSQIRSRRQVERQPPPPDHQEPPSPGGEQPVPDDSAPVPPDDQPDVEYMELPPPEPATIIVPRRGGSRRAPLRSPRSQGGAGSTGSQEDH
ncbi:MAG: mechanosensitive ion channel family protein [Acidimicrobiales bacterium]